MEQNYYEVLGVPVDASENQIKAAARQLYEKYSAMPDTVQKEAEMAEIDKAYKTLSSDYRRKAYDIYLEEAAIRLRQKELEKRSILDNAKDFFRDMANKLRPSTSNAQTDENNNDPVAQTTPPPPTPVPTTKLKAKSAKVKNTPQVATPPLQTSTPKLTKPKPIPHEPLPDETIELRTRIHLIYLLDFWGWLLLGGAIYLYITDPYKISQFSFSVPVWVPEELTQYIPDLSNVPIWYIGLGLLAFIGVLLLLEVLICFLFTHLTITSHRVIFTAGLWQRDSVQIKLEHFSGIRVQRSLFGWLLGYGTTTIAGMGGIRCHIPYMLRPRKVRELLWQAEAERIETILENIRGG